MCSSTNTLTAPLCTLHPKKLRYSSLESSSAGYVRGRTPGAYGIDTVSLSPTRGPVCALCTPPKLYPLPPHVAVLSPCIWGTLAVRLDPLERGVEDLGRASAHGGVVSPGLGGASPRAVQDLQQPVEAFRAGALRVSQ